MEDAADIGSHGVNGGPHDEPYMDGSAPQGGHTGERLVGDALDGNEGGGAGAAPGFFAPRSDCFDGYPILCDVEDDDPLLSFITYTRYGARLTSGIHRCPRFCQLRDCGGAGAWRFRGRPPSRSVCPRQSRRRRPHHSQRTQAGRRPRRRRWQGRRVYRLRRRRPQRRRRSQRPRVLLRVGH